MESNIYPKAVVSNSIVTLDKATVAAAIISELNSGKTKAQAIGSVLNGSDDVATFNEVYDELMNEGNNFRSINPLNYSTEAQYKAALNNVKVYLDVDTWVSGLYAEKAVDTFSELKTLFNAE